MSEGPVVPVTRDPASKPAVAVELGLVGGVMSALSPMLAEWNVPPATAVFASAVAAALFGLGMSYWRDRQFTKGV